MYKHQHKKKDSGKSLTARYATWIYSKLPAHISKLIYRKWIKTAASLTSVMGLTWITGVIVFHKALIPVAYIFTIFVAFEVTRVVHTWS